jgi:enoyl-[acyl-carrier protein] reductase II
MTEMLGIKYPIMMAGMSFIAEPNLVAAVSNAGGLGLLYKYLIVFTVV